MILAIGDLAAYSNMQPEGPYIERILAKSDGSIAIVEFFTLHRRMIARIDGRGALDGAFAGPLEVRLPAIVPVIEYYNASLDHYFITADRTGIRMLDLGAFEGRTRTFHTLHAWLPGSAPSSAARVCRL